MTVPDDAMAELRGVRRTFPPDVAALNGIDLQIRAGEVVSITGPSGSGKSTLLNVLGLLDRPSGGTYTLAGHDVGAMTERERSRARGENIGFIFQAYHLIAHLTVLENVLLPLRLRGRRPGAVDLEAAHTLLEAVGLNHRRDALPATLSGGERQRAAVARALITGPRLLLCDEPTGNLDTATGRAILHLILDAAADGRRSIVLVTHDPHVAGAADRQIHLIDGRVSG